MKNYDDTLRVDTVLSGKLRRYNAMPLWRQLLHVRTIVWPNIRDAFLLAAGIVQSVVKLLLWRPDVVFTKGGFVCLPIGIAARVLGIPLVIHDSDAHPGLTNRILARWAKRIATGAPLEYYSYPQDRTEYVGIPIQQNLKPLSVAERQALKQSLVGASNLPLVLVTGGGLGATRINNAIMACRERLDTSASVVLVSGTGQYDELANRIQNEATTPNFHLHGFIADRMTDYMAAADIVVARAGMTTILELAALARPTILIPNGFLTGGHQLKNAAVYAEADAVEIVDEHLIDETPQALGDAIEALLNDKLRQQQLGTALYSFAKPDAAARVAEMVVSAVTEIKS